jgi:hypothetical protein
MASEPNATDFPSLSMHCDASECSIVLNTEFGCASRRFRHPLQKNDYLISCLIDLEAKEARKGSIYDRVCGSDV